MAESGSGEQGSSALPEGVPAHPPTSFGVYYPEHDVVAIIDDQSDTSKAIEALIAAGIPAGHVHQLDKKLVLERDHNLRENPSLGARVARLVSFVMSDTGQYQQDYADEVATAIIRQHYAGYAPGTGLRAEWIEVAVPDGTDAEADQFNALYAGLTSGLFDAGMSGQANLSAAAATMPATLQVDWTCPTELLFTNILYSGLGNFNAQLAPLVGGTRDAFISEIQGWTTTALFGCVVNGGPSQSNAEALVSAIGSGAQLITTTEPDLDAAVANQTIHFSVGDAVLSSYSAIQPGFPGLNMNIAASTDPVGTAQQVAAFTLRPQGSQS